ncbi:MAG: 30S ribosomal protein S12 methylthiotransferase RimO [Prevotellaceae bacterium]|nr:30S ribosomal protein S12 methylthiotransferase RimO [Prevotellaceae bacterium]
MKKKINIVTLGCSKNTVDSEYLIAQLSGNNFEVLHDSNDESAKTVIINTCGFINDARAESINTIMNFAQAKKAGIIDRLFVFGCLSERYKPELKKEIPEADEFFGAKNLKDIVEALGGNFMEKLADERVITTPSHYAYLKISEGCSRRCGFCAIPLIRGKQVSVPVEKLESQARRLAETGVRELLVIAQDTTCYGMDLYGKQKLAALLEKLSEIEGIEWIRLHYSYPSAFPDELISLIRDNPKICKYLDVPFQHINDAVLSRMRRGTTRMESYDFIDRIRQEIPDVALRTTLMVGHPGETLKAFNELKKFVNRVRFERLGVFTYSNEEGTYAAFNFPDNISKKQKAKRANDIMSIQNRISAELNAEKTGKTMKIIVDRIENDFIVGRSEYDSPEIDQEVLVAKHPDLTPKPGDFLSVEITKADDYDLYAAMKL